MARGELDPVALAEEYLQRIEATAWANAWVTVDADGARRAARQAAAELASGRWRGPLHGIPVGVKDLVDTAGLRTTYGSGRFARFVPGRDASVVTLLRAAGAVILGKQATHEFAWGGRTDNPHFGPTRNPHDPDRIPGGSSGGGAASVVLRSCLLAIGTDTAGSVRIPAALSGCVGFKPTAGWLPLDGVYPLAPSLDHVGLMARTVGDVALAHAALARAALGESAPTQPAPTQPAPTQSAPTQAPVDAEGPGARPIRVGVPAGLSRRELDAAVGEALAAGVAALSRIGLEVVEVPDDPAVSERPMAILTLVRAEAERVHHDDFAADPRSYGPDLAELLALGPVPPDEERRAGAVAAGSVDWLAQQLRSVDVLLTATVPVLAPRIGELTATLPGGVVHVEEALTRLTSLANAAGAPAISVPAGADGPPVGLQLMGAPGADAALLRAAGLLERALAR